MARSPGYRRTTCGSWRTPHSSAAWRSSTRRTSTRSSTPTESLADQLVEAADLCCFVTTATRYADRVPWAVLSRVEERGLPLLVVVNRMPPDPGDRAEILADIRRLVAEAGLNDLLAATAGRTAARARSRVREGDLAPDGTGLEPETIEPLDDEIARLRAGADARRELASRALAGSLAGPRR